MKNLLVQVSTINATYKFSTLLGRLNPTVLTCLDAVTVRANQHLSFNALARHAGNFGIFLVLCLMTVSLPCKS